LAIGTPKTLRIQAKKSAGCYRLGAEKAMRAASRLLKNQAHGHALMGFLKGRNEHRGLRRMT
jgi:hypothetical protein